MAAMKIWFVQTLFHAWHRPSSFLWKNFFLGFVASTSIILYKTQNFAHRLEWLQCHENLISTNFVPCLALFLLIFMEKLFPGFVASTSIILYKTQNFAHRLHYRVTTQLQWKFDLYKLCSMPGIVPPHFYGKPFFWALWPHCPSFFRRLKIMRVD
jgi:hypothetical protein